MNNNDLKKFFMENWNKIGECVFPLFQELISRNSSISGNASITPPPIPELSVETPAKESDENHEPEHHRQYVDTFYTVKAYNYNREDGSLIFKRISPDKSNRFIAIKCYDDSYCEFSLRDDLQKDELQVLSDNLQNLALCFSINGQLTETSKIRTIKSGTGRRDGDRVIITSNAEILFVKE